MYVNNPDNSRLAPMLLKKVGKNCTPAEKSFGVGSTAECLESLAGHLVSWAVPEMKRLLMPFNKRSRLPLKNQEVAPLANVHILIT
jgi:hypothetical protein